MMATAAVKNMNATEFTPGLWVLPFNILCGCWAWFTRAVRRHVYGSPPLSDPAAPRTRGSPHLFALGDGRTLEYRVWGRCAPGDPVVICLPGMWMQMASMYYSYVLKYFQVWDERWCPQNCLFLFTRVGDDFTKRVDEINAMPFTFVSVSRPGYGASSLKKLPWNYTYDDLVPDVAAVADHLGAETFALYGWSSGGPCALAVANGLPDRVSATYVLCPDGSYFPGHPFSKPFHDGVDDEDAPATGYFSRPWSLFEALSTLFYFATPPGAVVDIWCERSPSSWFKNLEQIRCPVLLVHTRDDALVDPNCSRYMHARLPNSRLTLVPRGDDAAHTCLPRDVWDAAMADLRTAATTGALPQGAL